MSEPLRPTVGELARQLVDTAADSVADEAGHDRHEPLKAQVRADTIAGEIVRLAETLQVENEMWRKTCGTTTAELRRLEARCDYLAAHLLTVRDWLSSVLDGGPAPVLGKRLKEVEAALTEAGFLPEVAQETGNG